MHDYRQMKLPSTTASLGALVVGVVIGGLLARSSQDWLHGIAEIIEPIGTLWIRALQMIVLPLIITQLLVVVTVTARTGTVGRLGVTAVALFVTLLIVAAAFTVAVSPWALSFVEIAPETVAALQPAIPESAQAAAGHGGDLSLGERLTTLIPTNIFASIADGDLLAIILFTLLLGFAITRIRPQRREMLTGVIEALAEAVLIMIQWILWFTPIGVFALALHFARQAGFDVAGILVAFAVYCCALLIVFTIGLYPIATLIGRIRLRAFARSLYRAQVVAVSTRSSLATLPALIDGAKAHTDMPREVVGFALPFSASTFKINRGVSSTAKLLFLAHMYAVPLSAADIIVFVATVIILSFTTVGLPSGTSSFKTLPAYLAAGVPLEGYILLEGIAVIPDIFKTLINSTGYMTVTVLLSRFCGGWKRNEPEPTPKLTGGESLS